MAKLILTAVVLSVVALLNTELQTPQSSVEPSVGNPVTIPTRFAANRFFATPITSDNVTLNFYTDSAGALFLYQNIADRLKLTTRTVEGDNGKQLVFAALPSFQASQYIPAPLGSAFDGRLLVRQRENEKLTEQWDGMLGQQWFAGRVWTFDYPAKRLLWRAPGDVPKHDKTHEVALGFKTSPSGKRQNNFARIPIEVDGVKYDFLLDTGATNILPEDVLKMVGDDLPGERATSFLVRSVFDEWHRKHPEWRAFDKIQTLTGTAMIEVPEIMVGGFKAGPVWFTVQSDVGFQGVMKSYMDKPIVGALGGSALQYFRVTVDWPNAIAVFDRP